MVLMKPLRLIPVLLLASLVLSACATPTSTQPNETAVPNQTSTPLANGSPSSTPGPSVTPSPTLTATSTSIPVSKLGVQTASLQGLTLQVWHAFTGPSAQAFSDLVADFNASNEWGITVYTSSQEDYSGLYTAVNSALAGERPDIVAALPEQALAWDAMGAVVDLVPYVSDPLWGLKDGDLVDFPPAFWEQDEVGGRRLGVPAQRSTRLLFYNKTWARELGFSIPPTTSAEMQKQACAANNSFLLDGRPANDGYGGWIVDTDWMTVHPWMQAFGGGVETKGYYLFQTDANQSALAFMKGLYDQHCAWIADEADPYDAFARRYALFISGDLSELQSVADTMTRLGSVDDWTVLPYPGTSDGALSAYGPSYTVLMSRPEKQLAAWIFARWMLSAESQGKWAKETGFFPMRITALAGIADYCAAHPQWFTAIGLIAKMKPAPHLASWRLVKSVLSDGTEHLFRLNLPLEQIPDVLAEMQSLADEVSK
jgi:multiple sugar transport system substrate-binding protein